MFNFMRNEINIDEQVANCLNDDNAILVDVRTPEEYAAGHIPNSQNVPLVIVEHHDFDPNKTIYVYCRSGARSGNAQRLLQAKGYKAINAGGIINYKGKIVK